ncbi:MAG TPA: hypothetical protein H9971_07025 [Candidatus Dorea merdavium]|nr:hypothetical protein [Massilistercora timonensis]HIY55909.1 hypothetical protein [Candidatus Dorea merdavium]
MNRNCGKSWKYKMCGSTWRRRRLSRKLGVLQNSLREVYLFLNPGCRH